MAAEVQVLQAPPREAMRTMREEVERVEHSHR